MESPTDSLLAIERSLRQDTYKKGQWQSLLRRLELLSTAERQALSQGVSLVSNLLHARNGFVQLPLLIGVGFEIVLLLAALLLINTTSLWLQVIGVGALTLALQPSLKLFAGLMLGVRYAYVYLWYFEPRFKMQYGTYLALSGRRRVIMQLAGSIGTPVALVTGAAVLASTPWLAGLCLAAAVLAAAMQIAAFIAAWLNVRTLGPFLLTNLTTPAAAARELKLLLGNPPSQA